MMNEPSLRLQSSCYTSWQVPRQELDRHNKSWTESNPVTEVVNGGFK